MGLRIGQIQVLFAIWNPLGQRSLMRMSLCAQQRHEEVSCKVHEWLRVPKEKCHTRDTIRSTQALSACIGLTIPTC